MDDLILDEDDTDNDEIEASNVVDFTQANKNRNDRASCKNVVDSQRGKLCNSPDPNYQTQCGQNLDKRKGNFKDFVDGTCGINESKENTPKNSFSSRPNNFTSANANINRASIGGSVNELNQSGRNVECSFQSSDDVDHPLLM